MVEEDIKGISLFALKREVKSFIKCILVNINLIMIYYYLHTIEDNSKLSLLYECQTIKAYRHPI